MQWLHKNEICYVTSLSSLQILSCEFSNAGISGVTIGQ